MISIGYCITRLLLLVVLLVCLWLVVSKVLATVSVGLTLVVMTSVSGMLVDKAGRRSLMLIGTSIMAASLLSLSVALFAMNGTPTVQGFLVSCEIQGRGGSGKTNRLVFGTYDLKARVEVLLQQYSRPCRAKTGMSTVVFVPIF